MLITTRYKKPDVLGVRQWTIKKYHPFCIYKKLVANYGLYLKLSTQKSAQSL